MPDDIERVHQAVLDYAEGWFRGDLARMQRALHPSFSKRRAIEGGDDFETFGPDDIYAFIEEGIGVDPDCEITIVVDDVSGDVASARCYSCDYLDLLHLGKFADEWRLIHSYYRHLNDNPA